MGPAGRSSQSTNSYLPAHRQPSSDLNRTQSLQSDVPSRKSKAELRHALDDTDLDQFWVTTDEESDGEVPWRKGHGSRRRLTNVDDSLSRGSGADVAAPYSAEQPAHSAIDSQINQGSSRPVAANGMNGSSNTADAVYLGEVPFRRGSGAGVVAQSSEFDDYEMGVAKLREFEKQAGVDCPLEAKAAGVLVMQVQAKVARLGLKDVHQQEQITMCILEAEVARAHASATLSEWDGVGQGLRKLVTEKDAELQALRVAAAEQKKLAESSQAIVQDVEKSRQEAQSKGAEVEKLTTERNHLRVALSDAEMDLQNATSLLGEMKQASKQGPEGKKEDGREEGRGLEKRLVRRQSSLRLQEKLQAAEEVNRVNQGVVRGLEEQLRVVKDGWVKERAQWVKDAIAQQSSIMEHIKDRETYAKNKEREIRKMGTVLETARKTAEGQAEELKRKDAEIERLAANLETREKERSELAGEQTTAQAAMIAGLESHLREQTQLVKSLQEKTKAQSVTISGLEERVKEQGGVRAELESVQAQLESSIKSVESLRSQVASLENELRLAKSREAGLRVSNGAHETRAAQVAVGLTELTSRMNGLESEKAKLRSALEASENEGRELSAERETFLAQLKERDATVAAVKTEVNRLTKDVDTKLRSAVEAKEVEFQSRIDGLESKVSELAGALVQSQSENKNLLGVPEGRGDQQGNQERRWSFGSLGVEGQELLGVLQRRDGGQGSLERQVSSEEAEALSAELRVAKEERDKLQLRTEFLRKKVGELREQNGLQTEQAAATARSHDTELNRLRAEADTANRRAEQLGKTCRNLQAQLNHVAADVAPVGGSPTKRKRTRVDDAEGSEGVKIGAEGLGGVRAGLDARVSALEKVVSEKEWALAGKSRELQAKEAEVRGLQEILRVLARQLEQAEETPRKSNESGANSSADFTPAKSPASRSVDGSVLSAVKNALRGSMELLNTPRNSLEVARAVLPRGEPLNGSVSKERVALKREIRELYDRLERKEEELEEQTREYRAAEQSALATWQEKEQEVLKELEGKALKLGVMEEAFQELVTKLEESQAEAEAAAAAARTAEERAGKAEHARLMTKRRLEKLEELDKKGDGMWKELARLAAANASLQDQIVQLTSASASVTSEPSQLTSAPASSAQPEPASTSNSQASGDGFERQRGGFQGGAAYGLNNTNELSSDSEPGLPALGGIWAGATAEQLEGEHKSSSKGASVGGAEHLGGGSKSSSKAAPVGATAEPLSGRTASDAPAGTATKGHVSSSGLPSPSGGSAFASPATSPSSDAQKAQDLSNSVFDRLAILRQRYATDGAPDSPGAATPTAASFYSPGNKLLPVSPAGSSGKSTPGASFRSPGSKPVPGSPVGSSPGATTQAVAFLLPPSHTSLPVSPMGSSGKSTPGTTSPTAASFSSPGTNLLPISPTGSSGKSNPGATSPTAVFFHSPNYRPPVLPAGSSGKSNPPTTANFASPGTKTPPAGSPVGPRGKRARSQDEAPKEPKSGGGIRNLVRWLETKVPSRKSSSSSSPGAVMSSVSPIGYMSGDEQRSPGGDQPGSKSPLPTVRDIYQPGALGGPAKGAVGSATQKAFARELPRLELPEDVSENGGGKKSLSPDVRARLEILRQRTAQSQADNVAEGDPSPREKNSPVTLPRPRISFDGSAGGSPGMSERAGNLRREERVSAGFGSPQANAVPAILSWIPTLEALGGANRTPPMGERAKHGAEVGRSGDATKRVAGRWDDARGTGAGGVDSPSSVLERLAMLQARGNGSSNPAAT